MRKPRPKYRDGQTVIFLGQEWEILRSYDDGYYCLDRDEDRVIANGCAIYPAPEKKCTLIEEPTKPVVT